MRKTLSLVAGAMLAASLGIGHADAAALASCNGSTGIKGVQPPPNINPSYAGHCDTAQVPFTLTAPTSLTVTLKADPGFTGPLHAYLVWKNTCTPPAAGSTDPPCPSPTSTDNQAYGMYVGGQLASGFGSGTSVGVVPAGSWVLRVDTSGLIPNPSQVVGTPGGVRVDTAFGTFSATVTATTSLPAA